MKKTVYAVIVTKRDITKDGAVLPSGVGLQARLTKRGWRIHQDSHIWPRRFLPIDSVFELLPLKPDYHHSRTPEDSADYYDTNFDLLGAFGSEQLK